MSAESDRLAIQAALVIKRMDEIVTAVFKDLGESPEAMRGALVIADSARALMHYVVGEEPPPTAREVDAEMQSVGVVVGLMLSKFAMRAKGLNPDE